MEYFVDVGAAKNVSMSRAARQLLATGADPEDTLVGMRDGRRCLTGKIGWLADRSLSERDKGNPTFAWVKYVPFSGI